MAFPSQNPRFTESNPNARPDPVDILLVDDRQGDLRALGDVLSDPGYNLVTAHSGAEALRKVLERDFAVILLDVMMPGMDGFEVASTIKRRERSRYTPILFLTAAHPDISAIYRAYSVGAVDYLIKPLDEAVVRAKVGIFAELFRKDRRIREQAAALREADLRERELQLAEVRMLSEKRYRSLIETIPASVWTASPDGAVNYCNHHWNQYTGIRLDKTRGEGWLAAVHPADQARIKTEWESAVARGATYVSELRLVRADGTSRWHMCHAVPETDKQNLVRGWLVMFADCEDLKRAVETRDEFLSIASHELRTPLSTLLLHIEGLQRQLVTAGVDDRAKKKLDAALKQTLRLDALIGSLLDVARICAGRLQLEPEELDLSDIVRQCIERFGDSATRAGSTLTVNVDDGVIGRWDKLRIEQVVTNLLSNAVKYGAGKPVEVRLEADDGEARLSVRDHGIGVGVEHQSRIFERFERAVSSRHYGGLGMGLYITSQIVEAHGGAITLQSEIGEGSTFTVKLPRKSAAPKPA